MKGASKAKALDVYHLILAPTHACNLRCTHCYLPDHDPHFLPESTALRILDEWSDIVLEERGQYQGIFPVKGGEPFVTPYLGKIIDRLVELKTLQIMLTTNGTVCTARTFEMLRRAQVGLDGQMIVIVSLDGATAASHDKLRGPGTFDTTVGFIRTIRDLGINTHLNCVLYSGNAGEVSDYLTLSKTLGVGQVNFLPLVPKGFGLDLRAVQETHVTLHRRIQSAHALGDQDVKQLLAGSLSDIKVRERDQGAVTAHECVAAYRGLFYITPEGAVYTCPNLLGSDHALGNVNQDALLTLCNRLPDLYSKIRGFEGRRDQYICTGERVLYEKNRDRANQTSLRELQKELAQTTFDQGDEVVAYCVSRNF